MSLSDSPIAMEYIRVVMDKTKNNRPLALTIFKKLFQELPQQLDCIEDFLHSGDYENAKEVTHKMHGSVSFCGLTDMQEPAKKLEQCLINRNHQLVAQNLMLLQQRVIKFTGYQESILANLSNQSIR